VTECGSSGQAWSDPSLRRIDDFCLIADLADVDLLICDPHSKLFVACNRLAHTHLGYSREQLLALGPEAIQVTQITMLPGWTSASGSCWRQETALCTPAIAAGTRASSTWRWPAGW
jgi:hypothetical protein